MRSFEINGEKSSNPSTISKAFCSFFATIAKNLKESLIPLHNFVWRRPREIKKKTGKRLSFRSVS